MRVVLDNFSMAVHQAYVLTFERQAYLASALA